MYFQINLALVQMASMSNNPVEDTGPFSHAKQRKSLPQWSERAALGRRMGGQGKRTCHQAELLEQWDTFTKHQLGLLLGEPPQNTRKWLLGRICFQILGRGGWARALPFPELLSVDWDSLFTRFFPLRAS